jgi:hypothetical protein
LLRDQEYVDAGASFSYIDVGGVQRSMALVAGSLAFTLCQVPVTYTRGGESSVSVQYADGRDERIPGRSLPEEVSAQVFARSGAVVRIDVRLPG